jgi:hypothetical protein
MRLNYNLRVLAALLTIAEGVNEVGEAAQRLVQR